MKYSINQHEFSKLQMKRNNTSFMTLGNFLLIELKMENLQQKIVINNFTKFTSMSSISCRYFSSKFTRK